MLLGGAFFLFAAIGIMIFYIIGFQSKSFRLKYTREINRQNIILEQIDSEIDSSLTSMMAKMDSIEVMAEKIRVESKISEKDLKLVSILNVQLSESGITIPLRRVISYIDNLERRSFVFENNFNLLYNESMKNTDYLKRLPSIRPSSGIITRDFDFRQHSDNISLTVQTHSGIDITNDEGTQIVATADGIVKTTDYSDELGRYIEIDHQNGHKTRYTHLSKEKGILVKKGEKVVRGQVIGHMGRTGISIKAIAPHIMYSVEHHGTFVNPEDYFYASDYITENPGYTLSE